MYTGDVSCELFLSPNGAFLVVSSSSARPYTLGSHSVPHTSVDVTVNGKRHTVRQGVDLGGRSGIFGNPAQTRQSVDTVNVHRARAADTFAA